MLGMLGLAMVGSLSGQSDSERRCRGDVRTLMLATIGLPESQAIPRYTFGTLYLLDKLPLIPVLLGLVRDSGGHGTGYLKMCQFPGRGRLATASAKGYCVQALVTRSGTGGWWFDAALIGAYIGMLPGLGASIVGWATYAHAKQSVKDSSQFGQGDVRGLLAPEAANNALRGGALIPTLTLGIPGSVGTAILMGALIMHGLTTGTEHAQFRVADDLQFCVDDCDSQRCGDADITQNRESGSKNRIAAQGIWSCLAYSFLYSWEPGSVARRSAPG